MKTVECFIVYNGNRPMRVTVNVQAAKDFIAGYTNGQIADPRQWQIYKSWLDMPESDEAVAGKIRVSIPDHVLI